MATQTIDTRLVQVVQYTTPTNAQTININTTGNVVLLINPADTLAALTVNLPGSPSDGDTVTIGSSQILTALTIGNGTIIGTLTTLALGGYAKFVYNSTASKWFRIG